jgi:hypothetical protein
MDKEGTLLDKEGMGKDGRMEGWKDGRNGEGEAECFLFSLPRQQLQSPPMPNSICFSLSSSKASTYKYT